MGTKDAVVGLHPGLRGTPGRFAAPPAPGGCHGSGERELGTGPETQGEDGWDRFCGDCVRGPERLGGRDTLEPAAASSPSATQTTPRRGTGIFTVTRRVRGGRPGRERRRSGGVAQEEGRTDGGPSERDGVPVGAGCPGSPAGSVEAAPGTPRERVRWADRHRLAADPRHPGAHTGWAAVLSDAASVADPAGLGRASRAAPAS